MVRFTPLVLLASATGALASPCKPDHRPTAVIDSGTVAGASTSFPSSTVTVNKFLGIPFAAPPVRFSPPRPAHSWEGIYDATEHKPSCIQQFNYPEETRNRTMQFFNTPPPPAGESEDCLYLNVFAPAGATSEEPKAVLFWLYGGALMFGTGSLPGYDGSSFAANQDVVVVTINYRTNVFGFPGSPDLPKNQRNLGWLDQRLALKWVQRNIAAFGGDPDRVTIFGESAGGASVDALITLPPKPLPFHAAIMQSGEATVNNRAENAGVGWQELVELAGCPPKRRAVNCLRALPALELKEIIERNALSFGPVTDKATYAEDAHQKRLHSTAQRPLIARVPLMIGTTARDAWPLIMGGNDTAQYLRTAFPTFSEEKIQDIIAAYPISAASGIRSPAEQIAVIATEFGFQCPAKVIADGTADVGVPAWRYIFNASFPNHEIFPGSGAFHSSEIGLVFGTYQREGATPFQEELSDFMEKAWADFAKDPASGPGWDAVPEVGVLGGWDAQGQVAVTTLPSGEVDRRCEFFDDLYAAAL
ncbi:Carboxylesterase [Aspergillus egyptiacus]|nr:Carboxylesterase [Aspergillus egyptiacus]